MHVLPININRSTNFGVRKNSTKNINFHAQINLSSKNVENVCDCVLKKNLPQEHSSKILNLLNEVNNSLEQHPSKEVINFLPLRKNGVGTNSCTYISTQEAHFYDIEPIDTDVTNIPFASIRRILSPDNKIIFQLLTGMKYAEQYQPWWNKHIAPIWHDIHQIFTNQSQKELHNTDSFYNNCIKSQVDKKYFPKIANLV